MNCGASSARRELPAHGQFWPRPVTLPASCEGFAVPAAKPWVVAGSGQGLALPGPCRYGMPDRAQVPSTGADHRFETRAVGSTR